MISAENRLNIRLYTATFVQTRLINQNIAQYCIFLINTAYVYLQKHCNKSAKNK